MSNKTYSAIAIANAFLARASEDKKGISPMKMQKLIYFAHGWLLALASRPLINDDIRAWKYGPVIDSIYHEFKRYGKNDIDSLGTEFVHTHAFNDSNKPMGGKFIFPQIDSDDTDVFSLIDRIWEVYGKYDAITLSALTHEPGSPWHETRNEHQQGGVQHFILNNQLIKECISRQITTTQVS